MIENKALRIDGLLTRVRIKGAREAYRRSHYRFVVDGIVTFDLKKSSTSKEFLEACGRRVVFSLYYDKRTVAHVWCLFVKPVPSKASPEIRSKFDDL
ncbi:MAG: hypothetical protein WC444_02490 [Candidatus Paceibacterota bacterium]